jgi:hypothetical protein
MSLIERMLRMQDLTIEQYQDLSLIEVYHRLVQVLMHSSDDSAIQLQRDGDPQVFEQILLDDGESKLKLKDISLPGKQGCEDTLRQYAFNLQRHTVEKVAVEIDNCMLVSRKDGKIENIQSKKEDWFASYKKKSSFFDVASNEHLREFKDEAYLVDHHKISNTTKLKAEEKAAKKTEEKAAKKAEEQASDRSGRMHVYMVGENMEDASAQYSKVFFGAGAGVNCDIDKPLWEYLKQAGHSSDYDRELQERVFKVVSRGAGGEEADVHHYGLC